MSNLKLQTADADLGIVTTLHVTENKVAIQKTYDAEPFLDAAAQMRAESSGQRWGDARHIGFIPMAELAQFFRQDGGFDRKRCLEWIRKNPRFCTFERALK